MIKKLIEALNEVSKEKEKYLAYIKSKYPEEPFYTTAKAYADCILDWEIGQHLRTLDWEGVYTDAETFLKQAEIVGGYNLFNPNVAKKLVDLLGRNKEYRLGREGSVVVYVDGVSKDINLEKLQKELSADEVDFVGDELRIWWD